MSPHGKSIVQLFGYHLSEKLANRTFIEMGRVSQQIFVTLEEFKKYCETVWPDMGKYERVIPGLFKILKRGEHISLHRIDLFV